MTLRLLVLATALSALSACVKRAAEDVVGPGDYERSFRDGDRTRRFFVHMPSGGRSGVLPVILSLHGGGGDAAGQALTDRLDAKSDSEGFIVVRPEGIASVPVFGLFHIWNAGGCCGKAVEENVDDVGFIAHVIDRVVGEFHGDPRRIYATGLSNGAMMATRLACELSDRIAAVAPVAGGLMIAQCMPKRPVSMLYFHGTDDHCLPINGPAVGGCFSEVVKELSGGVEIKTTEGVPAPAMSAFLASYRQALGLTDAAKPSFEHGQVKCLRNGPDARGVELEACTIAGGGHTWPGGGYGGPCKAEDSRFCRTFQRVSGALSNDIDADDAMWRFFQRHTLPN